MTTDITRDNGATFSYDWKTNIWKFDVPYVVTTIAELASFSPDFLPMGLPATSRRGGERKDGQWDLSITHEGCVGTSAEKDTAELDYMTAEDPIETFEKFVELAKKYKAKFAPDNPDKLESWPKTISIDGGDKEKNPVYGTTHFRNPSPIWRVTLTRKTLSLSVLRALGKICTPMAANGQNPPELDDGANWLKSSVKASYKGNVWVIVIEFIGSGPGGFVRDIYGSTSGSGDIQDDDYTMGNEVGSNFGNS